MFKFLKEKLGGWAKKISKDKSKEEKQEEVKSKKKVQKTKVEKKAKPKAPVVEVREEKAEVEFVGVGGKAGSKSFFDKIKAKVQRVRISEEEFEVYSEDLKMLLLENNVAFEVADKIIEQLGKEIIGKELLRKEVESEIKDSLKKIIRDILVEPFDIVEKIKSKKENQTKEPFVILFAGVNGTGKTTTVAKIASFLKKKNFSCVFAAADTFRAASIEQIEKHGERVGVKVISHQYGSDPASVGFDAIQYAKKNSIDVVLIDTAGRMHTSKNLLKEIEKIVKVCKPDLKLFIGEAITGNDSVEQVKSFDWAIHIDGIVLTKADVDEKGGSALSVGYVTKRPILFLGTGQEYNDIEVFNKEKFLKELGL